MIELAAHNNLLSAAVVNHSYVTPQGRTGGGDPD